MTLGAQALLRQESNQKHEFLFLMKDTVGEDLLTHCPKLAEQRGLLRLNRRYEVPSLLNRHPKLPETVEGFV